MTQSIEGAFPGEQLSSVGLNWLWVKNRYPKWSHGKWNQGLKPAVQFLVV